MPIDLPSKVTDGSLKMQTIVLYAGKKGMVIVQAEISLIDRSASN